jgi:hypothetical protein
LAKYHDLCVLTSICQKPGIERELAIRPLCGVTFHYHGLLAYRMLRGVGIRRKIYGLIWSLTVIIPARKLHRQHRFDLAHQVTLARYWWPNALAFSGIPFVFGPVSGGDVTPRSFLRTLPFKMRISEGSLKRGKSLAEKTCFWQQRRARCVHRIDASRSRSRTGAPRVDTIF